jgi:hypothetical protein
MGVKRQSVGVDAVRDLTTSFPTLPHKGGG